MDQNCNDNFLCDADMYHYLFPEQLNVREKKNPL